MHLLCDADANGAEVAQYEVYLPEPGKRILLCGHHMRESWPAMQETSGIVALRMDAVDKESFDILRTPGEDGNSAFTVMQTAIPAFKVLPARELRASS